MDEAEVGGAGVLIDERERHSPSVAEEPGLDAVGEQSASGPEVPTRRGSVLLVAVVVVVVVAALLAGSTAWAVASAHRMETAAAAARDQQQQVADQVRAERQTLDATTQQAAAAAAALETALARIPSGGSEATDDADLAAAQAQLADGRAALDQLTGTAGADDAERQRILDCLTSAQQALGVAQTSPPHSESIFAAATEACRTASGTFTTVGTG